MSDKIFYSLLFSLSLATLPLATATGNRTVDNSSLNIQGEVTVPEDEISINVDIRELQKTRYYNQNLRLSDILDSYGENYRTSDGLERSIIIDKSDRTVELYLGDERIKEYGMSLGQDPIGDKNIQGDMRTPEGEFYVSYRNPNSKFGEHHISLMVSYPNLEDAERGLNDGHITRSQYNRIISETNNCRISPQNTKLGGAIMIHGGGGGIINENNTEYRINDWTWGCIAINDSDMLEVYLFSKERCNTKVTINP